MNRPPQPMRRMAYIIGELQRQAGLRIPIDLASTLEHGRRWLRGEGQPGEFILAIICKAGEWFMRLEASPSGRLVLMAAVTTAPDGETVWLDHDATPHLLVTGAKDPTKITLP